MTLTTAQAKARSDAAQRDQIQYNQNASDNHGQSSGAWRCDCSGLICAIHNLAQGVGCPSTYELAHSNMTGAPYTDFDKVVPYKTIVLVTNEDGFPFGHVAQVTGKNGNQIQIQEHGGGVGPDLRWLPRGVIYDSDQKYGQHRNFRFYDITSTSGSSPVSPPRPPAVHTKGTPFPFPSNEYFGDINGPNASHGGYYPAEKAKVAAIQRIVGVRADGVFGPSTTKAVLAWQNSHRIPGVSASGKVGPLTWKAMGL